jgi:branched-chain amino acid transport system ATP-binding protein
MSMLELNHITASYGKVPVLRDVSLRVPAAGVVALLGANGAGKTTLLRTAAGLLHHSAGNVLIDGAPADGLTPHARALKGVCLIPEGRAIFRGITVRENIQMFIGGRQGLDAAIERAAGLFPILGDRLSQIAGTMSGGQQQMLALTRALVTNPRLVMVDEVSLGLAPVVIDAIFAALATLRSEGTSLLIVEQYAERALAVADYVYVLSKGRVIMVGEPGQLDDKALRAHYLGATEVTVGA